MIYTEGFGAESVRGERVLLDVGFTASPMRRKVLAIDYSQVFAADKATNEVDAPRLPPMELPTLRLSCGVMQGLGCMKRQLYTCTSKASQGLRKRVCFVAQLERQ